MARGGGPKRGASSPRPGRIRGKHQYSV